MAARWRKVAWFVGIWLASVAVLLVCSYLIRLVLAD